MQIVNESEQQSSVTWLILKIVMLIYSLGNTGRI